MLAVFGTKGSPGATTVSLLLAAVTSDSPLMVEADPAGGVAALRLAGEQGQVLPAYPSVSDLAVTLASTRNSEDVWRSALRTACRVSVVCGVPSSAPMERVVLQHGPVLAAVLRSNSDVVVDGGRLTESSPARVFAASAHAVVLVASDTSESVYQARDLAESLTKSVARDAGVPAPVIPVVVADAKRAAAACKQLDAVFETRGIPVEKSMCVARDPRALAAFLEGGKVGKTALLRSAAAVAHRVGELTARASETRSWQPSAQRDDEQAESRTQGWSTPWGRS